MRVLRYTLCTFGFYIYAKQKCNAFQTLHFVFLRFSILYLAHIGYQIPTVNI